MWLISVQIFYNMLSLVNKLFQGYDLIQLLELHKNTTTPGVGEGLEYILGQIMFFFSILVILDIPR